MRRRQIIFIFAALVTISVGFTNCGRMNPFTGQVVMGTEIGNPAPATSDSQGPMSQIMMAACQVLTKCNPALTTSQCQADFLQVDGVGAALGLPAGIYDPFSSLIAAQSTFVINQAALSNCVTQTVALACADPNVVKAYSTTLSNPLTNAAGMLPAAMGSCPSVLSQ